MGTAGNSDSFDLMSNGLSSVVAAAHELKSPLSLIRQLSLLLDDDGLSDAERDRMISQVTLTSERALRLTSDLTKSIKLADAMFTMEPINPQQLCDDIVSELRPLFEANHRELRFVKRKHPLLLVANRDLLRRVIMNFSDNALHYSDSNTPVEIQLGLRNYGKTVRVGVRDYGPALPVNTLESLGERLTANSSIVTRPQSSGLGIYIARQFADVMSGRIGVTRHRNGSTFYVDLPASNQLSLI